VGLAHPLLYCHKLRFSLFIGYGLPHGINSFFEEGCANLQIIIYFQMAWSMIFNAFLLAFLYARLGRSESRSNQVICSNKALVTVVDGQVRFQLRLFDNDAQHPLVEPHVRLFCVMNNRPVPRPLRLLQPDDELGGMLFLSFPTVVSHHIDMYSLLHPPSPAVTIIPGTSSVLSSVMEPGGLVLRQVDGATNSRDDVICPVCGESYGTLERWRNHVKFNQIAETKDEWPMEGSHQTIDIQEIERLMTTKDGVGILRPTQDLTELEDYFRRNVSEIICVVEAIDPLQSGTFQALQSYRIDDIVWDTHLQFAPCLEVKEAPAKTKKYAGDGIFQVDLDRFHDICPDTTASKLNAPTAGETGNHFLTDSGTFLQPVAPTKRRRRCKTVSNRPGDSMFVSNPPNTKAPPSHVHSV